MAEASREKGLLIVNTGSGKGKSTAAFGMGVRALAHGMKLGVVQFIKGAMRSSEREFFSSQPNCCFKTIGDGYTWMTQDCVADASTAMAAWDCAASMIKSGDYQMVILDELTWVLKYKYLDLDEVLAILANRRSDLHVVVTGRHAPAELIEIADLVSEIKNVKHPFKEQGVKAQKGVEF